MSKLEAAKEFDKINNFLSNKHGILNEKTTTENIIEKMNNLDNERQNLKVDIKFEENISNENLMNI